MVIYLIRHGQTDWNKDHRFQGQVATELNETGVRAAEKTRDALKAYPIDMILSSPLKRAVDTAKIIAEGINVPVVIEPELIEVSFGAWEGTPIKEGSELYSGEGVLPEGAAWRFRNTPFEWEGGPGGETYADVMKRIGAFVEKLEKDEAYRDRHIVFSIHGVNGRCLLRLFMTDEEYEKYGQDFFGYPAPNCSVSILVSDENGRRIEAVDQVFD